VKLDVHNHAVPRPAAELLRSDPVYRVKIEDGRWIGGNHVDFELPDSFLDADAKLAELERSGLDGAIVSCAPPAFYYELEGAPAEDICRAVNAGLAGWHAAAPDRLWWMAHVPLQAPELAAAMLEETVAQPGCVGVEVGSAVAGGRLDEERFEPFWAAAERAGVPVMIHPDPSYVPHPSLAPFYLGNVIGMPLETTITIKRLIAAGVLERHPKLRVLLLHGGGYLPYQAGRLRHATTVRPELAHVEADPWDALDQLWFDVITHDARALAYLVDRAVAGHVVLGTDLPFDMALPDPVAAIEAAVGAAGAAEICERNPAALFGLSANGAKKTKERH
jgi:aminocarboxymuconate-semialdehyde decarboxylase